MFPSTAPARRSLVSSNQRGGLSIFTERNGWLRFYGVARESAQSTAANYTCEVVLVSLMLVCSMPQHKPQPVPPHPDPGLKQETRAGAPF